MDLKRKMEDENHSDNVMTKTQTLVNKKYLSKKKLQTHILKLEKKLMESRSQSISHSLLVNNLPQMKDMSINFIAYNSP